MDAQAMTHDKLVARCKALEEILRAVRLDINAWEHDEGGLSIDVWRAVQNFDK